MLTLGKEGQVLYIVPYLFISTRTFLPLSYFYMIIFLFWRFLILVCSWGLTWLTQLQHPWIFMLLQTFCLPAGIAYLSLFPLHISLLTVIYFFKIFFIVIIIFINPGMDNLFHTDSHTAWYLILCSLCPENLVIFTFYVKYGKYVLPTYSVVLLSSSGVHDKNTLVKNDDPISNCQKCLYNDRIKAFTTSWWSSFVLCSI